MKKLNLIIVVASISGLFSCSPTMLQEKSEGIKPNLSLVSPNGVRLANSMSELMLKTRPTVERMYGPSVNYTVTKISYDGVASFEDEAIKGKTAVAKVDFKTSVGQTGNFIYVNTQKSVQN
ncbi:hypothetical protein [Spirosoma pollinicola]|uniref:Uncharacterized protein n=1 Tax=Spirosoma pollinicola TaxID=2057025 RepID=A0A2K8YYQ9_9BACT|nr:hypothetical protein [Spirosoma pollinicola]AUD02714.1 hypothetical protein CWM47_13225 [Spirosoma pollinicola]